jgi:primosomal protein N' (replication factor Y)
MIRLIIRGADDEASMQYAQHLAQCCQAAIDQSPASDIRMLGPAPAPITKVRDKYRYHLLLLCDNITAIRDIIARVYEEQKPPIDIQWVVDVDPQNLL